jgi:hypothetical protein
MKKSRFSEVQIVGVLTCFAEFMEILGSVHLSLVRDQRTICTELQE